MTRTGIISLALALVAGWGSTATAQKHAPAPHPQPVNAPPRSGVTPATRATPAKPGGHGDRATPAVRATPASASQNKESKAEKKAEDRAFASARSQSERLTRHIKLTADEKEQYNAIRKSYDKKYKDLEKQERSADKSGQSETAIMQQLQQLRTQERSDIRELLTATQQKQFDRNAAALTSKK
jgi:hypothetical protein